MHPCTGQSANKAKTVRGKIPAGQAAVAHPGSTAGDFTFKFVPGLPSSTFGTSGAALGAMGAESGNSAREIRPCAAKRTRFLPIRTEPQRRADDAKEHRSDTSPHCEQTVNPDPDMPSRMLDPCLARLPSRGSCSAPSGGARLRTASVFGTPKLSCAGRRAGGPGEEQQKPRRGQREGPGRGAEHGAGGGERAGRRARAGSRRGAMRVPITLVFRPVKTRAFSRQNIC
jgi:hypothetical protein